MKENIGPPTHFSKFFFPQLSAAAFLLARHATIFCMLSSCCIV
jgi:hypothetical protein